MALLPPLTLSSQYLNDMNLLVAKMRMWMEQSPSVLDSHSVRVLQSLVSCLYRATVVCFGAVRCWLVFVPSACSASVVSVVEFGLRSGCCYGLCMC